MDCRRVSIACLPRLGGVKLLGAALAAALLFLPFAGPSAARADALTNCIQLAGNDLIAAAQKGSASAFRAVITRHADIEQIALFALGPYRKQLPAARQAEYVALVEAFVAKILADNYRKFRAVQVEVLAAKPQGGIVTVDSRLRFIGGKPPQKVIWRVTPAGSGCKVFDVNVTNVWLGVQLKSALTSEIQRAGGSIDAVFAYLQPAGRGVVVQR